MDGLSLRDRYEFEPETYRGQAGGLLGLMHEVRQASRIALEM